MSRKFALVGNQNCGKTTLFNMLTKSNRRVGNFPGVTVEKSEGILIAASDTIVIDLPGIYSLCPYTDEERVSVDYILNEKPDLIINVVDAANPERNLYLTLSLMQLDIPMVVVLSMTDENLKSGVQTDILKMSKMLGTKVICANAKHIADECVKIADTAPKAQKNELYKSKAYCAAVCAADLIKTNAKKHGVCEMFAAKSVLSNDTYMEKRLELDKEQLIIIQKIKDSFENEFDAATAKAEYDFVQKICGACFKNKPRFTKRRKISISADKILTNKFLAVPIFFTVMLLVFVLTFATAGKVLSACFELILNIAGEKIGYVFELLGVSKWLTSLILNGILAGVGSVASFMPSVIIMFLCLSFLEDSGYMARVVFIFDKFLKNAGISGRGAALLLMGVGCSVPAIISTRTLFEKREKCMVILLLPFVSCSAKTAVYMVFASVLFPKNSVAAIACIYIFSAAAAFMSAKVLKNSVLKGESCGYVMELPVYRMPHLRNVVLNVRDRVRDFFLKTFKVIFLSSVIIWALQSLDTNFAYAADSAESLLAHISKFIAPVFSCMGFGNRQAAAALLSGVFAKETIVSTLLAAANVPVDEAVGAVFSGNYAAAGAFLAFVSLYMPCIASLAAMRRETGSVLFPLCAAVYQTCFAYVCSLGVYMLLNVIG